jgi:DNA polymerase (family 10)
MDNASILRELNRYAKLAELHQQNPFRYKAFATAAFNLRKTRDDLKALSDDELSSIQGVGKGVLAAIRSMASTGRFPELDALKAATPPGVIELLDIKGLGPKKVLQLWKEAGIEEPGALLDACRENRLVQLPGFGLKTQADILKALEFAQGAAGKMHYARAARIAAEWKKKLDAELPGTHAWTGALRRASEVLASFELLSTIETSALPKLAELLELGPFESSELVHVARTPYGLSLEVYLCRESDFSRRQFELSGPEAHLQALGYEGESAFSDEMALYAERGYALVPPECRENPDCLQLAKSGMDDLLEAKDLRGVLHNHSTWSDGLNSIEEMARACIEGGYTYFGICDHSRSAGYAGGLSAERVLQQFEEIDVLNAKLAPFRIFKGIESDILADGSLDYEDDILARFDIVVASIHSNLKMEEDKATERLIRAVENPYTTILGHPTGRLLLIRRGYPIDHRKVIDACAANGVAIEINAHPYRLDIDWHWLDYCMEKEVMISINPDAHEKSGIHDMQYGLLAARKGLLQRRFCLNALSCADFEHYLAKRKSLRMP